MTQPTARPMSGETNWNFDMSEAPRDGRNIIVFRPKFDGDCIPQVGNDYWFKAHDGWCWGRSRSNTQPVAWMEYPAAPSPDQLARAQPEKR